MIQLPLHLGVLLIPLEPHEGLCSPGIGCRVLEFYEWRKLLQAVDFHPSFQQMVTANHSNLVSRSVQFRLPAPSELTD